MAKIAHLFLFAVANAGCASEVAGPMGADTVNPTIEQRIEENVAEGRSAGFPDLRSVPGTPPPRPSAQEQAVSRDDIITRAEGLVSDIDTARAAERDAQLAARAEALRDAVAADRAAAGAEGLLSTEAIPILRPDPGEPLFPEVE